jgi:16S rRNA (cytosine967-C5)-methyltransferase
VLRLGAYQLLYMDGVPDYAAVSETVEQARAEVGTWPTGFVNAVLRKVHAAGDGPDRFPDEATDPLGFLATWGSHPEWMVRRWLGRWDVPTVRALVEADNRRPPIYLVPLSLDPAEAARRLADSGIGAEAVGAGTGCVQLDGGARCPRLWRRFPTRSCRTRRRISFPGTPMSHRAR